MKKILFTLALLISFSSFGQSRDLKKAIKKLGNVEITNKGLDLTQYFSITYTGDWMNAATSRSDVITNWEKAFFKVGLTTEPYAKYKVELFLQSIVIKDSGDNLNTVAIIEWSKAMRGLHSTSKDKPKLARQYLIQELINSNK